ncbi:FAD-binding domain-containing protein [Polyplosphaeria fusca]|uniref:FAD-binding domain-containing protein n=1 Tax=Polyplosphaeria fusca TaxID=682080 RepID=A0A9P4RAY5_9PLEO|nr:FAD-binding domain-containing protein [Polyplosphaeria fusca]
MWQRIAAISTLLAAAAAYPQQTSAQITQEFRDSISSASQIFFPSDSNWANETTQRWDVYEPTVPTYVAAIKPATEADVSAAVQIAQKNNIPFLATGGGHSLSVTLGKLKNGISIDLGHFKKVVVDSSAQTVTLGGANIIRDAIGPVWDAGFELVTGSCSCVGLLGATLGGGVGRLQGLHGLILDNVISFKVVLASGKIVTASKKENSDLFWGMRGAGHNLGIVLEATYKIYKATNGGKALLADVILPANVSHAHWETWKKLVPNLPAELAMFSLINYDETVGGINILLNFVYYGPEDKGRKLIAPFLANSPLVSNITYINVKDVFDLASFGRGADPNCRRGNYVNSYSVGTKNTDVATLDKHFADMKDFYEKYPQARGSTTTIESLPVQGVLAQPKNSTAYPSKHREIRTHMLWGYVYTDMSIDAKVNAFAKNARDLFTKTSGFDDLELYATYAHGDEGPDVWYRESLPNLKSLKARYDSKNVFRYMFPVQGS